MSKRHRRSRPRTKPKGRPQGRRRPPRREEEPDLLDQIADALDDGEPLTLLTLASTMLAVFDPRSRDPFGAEPDGPSREAFVESFLGVPAIETSTLLAAVAALSGDEVLRRRVLREVTDRAHALPGWLAGLSRAVAAPDAVAVTHALGDGENVLVAVELPSGDVLTAVVLVEHNLGSIVKDAFVLPEPLDDVVAAVREAAGADADLVTSPLPPADAKARILEAVEVAALTHPPYETDTWPACRALVEWMAALLPDGGAGYERPEWDDDALADLRRRFEASRFAAGVDDPGDMLSSLLWFGTDYGPGDPLRWSPVSAEILLLDWVPRKIMAEVELLDAVPELLRAFVRFCHAERGIRAGLTDETLAAIDDLEPEYQRLIRTGRPQGATALLDALGAFDGAVPQQPIGEILLERLCRAVGDEATLDGLDAEPLPEEPFGWAEIPADVHDRVGEVLALVDRCCTELLDGETRTACRRLLADAAVGDPDIFRRRGRPETAAAAVCWIVGKANALVGALVVHPQLQVKELTAYFGLKGSSVSQRSAPFLSAIGVNPYEQYGEMGLETPRYLTGRRRAQILVDRDRFRAMVD